MRFPSVSLVPAFMPILVLVTVAPLAGGSCLSACFGQTIGDGAARLSVRQAGALTALVNADADCGFASEAVLASVVVEGEPGGPGRSIARVTGCAIDVVDVVLAGCDGDTRVTGRVVVDATRTLEGTVTGRDGAGAILPAGPDAVAIEVSARVEQLRVVSSGDDNVMTQEGGTFAFTARPLLAADVDSGLCAVATSNVRFAPLSMKDANVTIDTAELDVVVRVADAALEATNGLVGAGENVVAGTMTIDDHVVTVAGVLVEGYDRDAFTASFSCNERLAQPVDFDCAKPTKLVAGGAARLAVQALGKIVATLQADAACGFADRAPDELVPDAADAVRGTAVWRSVDCPVTTSAGTLVVRAEMSLRGRLTGDALTPVIPEDSDAVTLAVLDARGAYIVETEAASLVLDDVVLSGAARPRLAVGEDGICNVATAHARVDVAIAHADATLVVGALRVPAVLDGLAIAAVNGRAADGTENSIDGALLVDGELVRLDREQLVTGLDPAAFDAAVDATEGIRAPASFDCDPRAFLGLQAARLLVSNTGDLAGRLGDDDQCGFGGGVLLMMFPEEVADLDDDTAVAVHLTEGCTLAGNPGENCLGTASEPLGTATFEARLLVTGERTLGTDVILPGATDATRLEILRAQLVDAGKRTFEADGKPGPAHLTATGVVSAAIEPLLARGGLGFFDVGTPVAHIEVQSERLDATLFLTAVGDVALPVVLEDVDLRANNGPAADSENTIEGTLVLDGRRIDIPAGTELVPDQSAGEFDASYVCGGVPAVGR